MVGDLPDYGTTNELIGLMEYEYPTVGAVVGGVYWAITSQ
jgi:hypothetical protein